MAESIELGRFEKTNKESDSEIVVVTRGTYAKNPEHLDIRCYYDANKGESCEADYKPTRQGVRMDIEKVPELLKAIGKVYGESFDKELNDLMNKHNI